MIKLENISVFNIGNSIRGMRNPLESWSKSDSVDDDIGPNDLALAKKLVAAGSDHSKFMRQIFVSMDITSSLSWWIEMDTYKVSTVRNSTSRMHKLGSRLLTPDDFSWDDRSVQHVSPFRQEILENLNMRIEEWQRTKDELLWRSIILDLPCSYNYMSTWTGNYAVLRNIYHARKAHKQREFREFCGYIERLPYSELITL